MRFILSRLTLIACVCLVLGFVVLVRVFGSVNDAPDGAAQPTAAQPVAQQNAALVNTVPALRIADAQIGKGDSGITDVPFTVTLNRPSDQPVSVVYTTSAGTATVTDGDYVGNRGTLTFLPGEMSKIITVRVDGNTRLEHNAPFNVTLSDALHATISGATATGTIIDTDQQRASAPTGAPTFVAPRGITVMPIPTPSETPTPQPSPMPSSTPTNVSTTSVVRPAGDTTSALYLPWLQRPSPPDASLQPDLMVESIELKPANRASVAGSPVEIRITIHNVGGAAVTSPFWVDMYINPVRAPEANTLWNTVCGITPCPGVAWHVTQTLAPDQRITLTTMQPDHTYSLWEGWLPAGTTTIVAYVDSWSRAGTSGAVQESDEQNNRAELTGINITGANPPSIEGSADQLPSQRP